MRQTIREKCEAIKSVLPLLHEHYDLICRIRTTMERLTPPAPDGKPRIPPPPLPEDPHDPAYPAEAWERRLAGNVWRWRLTAVAWSLDALGDVEPLWALAVYHEHVEPWPEWNPLRRESWADAGVLWMAHEIPGEMPYCERTAVKPGVGRPRSRKDRDDVIVRLAQLGCTYGEIAREAGCSRSTVSEVLLAHGIRSERTRDAVRDDAP